MTFSRLPVCGPAARPRAIRLTLRRSCGGTQAEAKPVGHSRLRAASVVPMLRPRGRPARKARFMTLFDKSFPVGLATAALVLGLAGGRAVADTAADVALAPHRAIYDLKLAEARGKRSLEAVRGRIVYDFSGSACEGYALQFRQVTELDNGEGKISLSDLRTTTWEQGDGKSFRFKSQNYMDRKQISEVDGQADRARENVAVKLSKPGDKKFEAGTVVFPTEHMRLLIEAARAGKSLLEVQVYGGSESGVKSYQSLSVIGHRIEPDKKMADAAAVMDMLAGMARCTA